MIQGFRLFLTESQNRIEGIKKAHLASLANYMLSDKNHDIRYGRIAKSSEKYHYDDSVIPAHEYTAHMLIDHLAKADPDVHKKHVQWGIKQYKSGNIRSEDIYGGYADTLHDFKKYGHKLQNRDINAYDIHSLRKALAPHKETDGGTDVVAALNKHPGATKLHDEPGLIVHRLDTIDAAQQVRKCDPSNRWCTSRLDDENAYHDYASERDPLYVVHMGGKTAENRYQFHFGTGQFADNSDEMYHPEGLIKDHPKLMNVEAFKQHGKGSLPFVDDEDAHLMKMAHPESPLQHRKEAAEIPGEHLKLSVQDQNAQVRRRAAAHSSAPWRELLNDSDSMVKLNITRTHPESHELLMNDESVVHYLSNFSKNPKVIDKMLQHPDSDIRRNVLHNNARTDEHTWKLANDKDWKIREQTAMHSGHPDINAHLANDSAAPVRAAVAQWNGPHLEKLMHDPDEEVRSKVATHMNYHMKMMNDPSVSIRAQIGRAAQDPRILDRLSKDESPQVRHSTIMADKKTRFHFANLVNDPVSLNRRSLATIRGDHNKILMNDSDETTRNRAWETEHRN